MLQFTNADLDAALAPGQERTIRPILQVDWLKDGLFSGPAGRLTSDNLIQVDCVDDVDSAMPDEVSGRPTSSSTILTATFHGEVEGSPLWQLFSPWNRESPYHGLSLDGSAVQFDVWTATSGGSTETRRFTGWVDSIQIDRIQGTVSLVAKNNLHLLGKRVTLPRWARFTNASRQLPHISGWDIPTEDRMENAPLTAAYLFQNVLRQCDAVPGPDPRSACLWFSSGYGGLIPEIGSLGNADTCTSYMSQGVSEYVYPENWGFPNYNRDILSFGELGFPSPIHRPTQPAGSSSDLFDTYSQAGTTEEVVPGPATPRYMNGGLWARVPTGQAGAFVRQDLFLSGAGITGTSAETDSALIRLTVGASNTTLLIKDDVLASSPVSRTLTVATPTTKDQLIYVSWEVDLQSPGNSRIWYNNVLQTTSSSGTLATYPRLDPGMDLYFPLVRVWARATGWLNAEIWRGSVADAGARVPTWANSPYGRKDFAIINGGLYAAVNNQSNYVDHQFDPLEGSGTMPCVTHIPVRIEVDAWELLKEMAAAFTMAMWIDNYGGLRIMPQGVLEILEERLTDPRKQLDGDSLQGLTLTTASDNIRDQLVYTETRGQAQFGVVFSGQDPWQFRCNASSNINYRVPAPPTFLSSMRTGLPLNHPGLGGGGFEWDRQGGMDSWGQAGFMACEEGGYAGDGLPTITVLPVYAAVVPLAVGQSEFEIRIESTHTAKTFLAYGNDGSAPPNRGALLIPGMYKRLDLPLRYVRGSGSHLLQLPLSEFHSASWTLRKTFDALLRRTSRPIPRTEDFTIPGDPRREVYDLIDLKDPSGGLDIVISQIIGRADSWSSGGGYEQRLSVRLTVLPGSWLLGVPGFSEIGETTYLS